MLGSNGSMHKYINALSGIQVASGSGGASNFVGYEFATLVALSGSVGGTTNLVVQRSATSDGTFGTWTGASLPAIGASGKLIVRSFTLDSSAIWHRLVYDKTGTQLDNIQAAFILGAPRVVPVPTQDEDTTVYSDVLGG